MDLLAFERKLDQTISRKRMEIQEAIKKPIMVPRLVFCFGLKTVLIHCSALIRRLQSDRCSYLVSYVDVNVIYLKTVYCTSLLSQSNLKRIETAVGNVHKCARTYKYRNSEK